MSFLSRLAIVGVVAALISTGCKKEGPAGTADSSGGSSGPSTPASKPTGAAASDPGAGPGAATPAGPAADAGGSAKSKQLQAAKALAAGIVNSATEKSSVKDLTGYFTTAAKARIDGSMPDLKELNDAIDAFQKAWAEKYKKPFKITDLDATFDSKNFDLIPPGEFKMRIQIGPFGSEIKVPVAEQDGALKLEVPDELTGKKVIGNIAKGLQRLTQNAATWPDSEVEAAREVTKQVIGRIVDYL